jgi:hypothetical protein
MAGGHRKRIWPEPMSRKKSISLDLRWLEYFVAVADAGSILGAAFRLGITQPPVSEAMARLESQLDVRS